MTKFITATGAFRDKYFGLPGDITNATDIWGKDTTKCNGATGVQTAPGAGATGTCNGTGDQQVNGSYEYYRYWQQLALAGLLEGQYTGGAAAGWSGANFNDVIGTNLPASKLLRQGYSIHSYTGFGVFWIPATPARAN